MAAFLYSPTSHFTHFENTTTIYKNKNTSTSKQFLCIVNYRSHLGKVFIEQTALQTDTIHFLVTQKPLAIIRWVAYKFYKTP